MTTLISLSDHLMAYMFAGSKQAHARSQFSINYGHCFERELSV